ncbi:MAG: hypothetical protein ACRC62_20770 [Microcoleus sp.]
MRFSAGGSKGKPLSNENVEFSDRTGRTYESVGLYPEQIMVLYFEPASPDRQLEMVTV